MMVTTIKGFSTGGEAHRGIAASIFKPSNTSTAHIGGHVEPADDSDDVIEDDEDTI